MTTLCGASRGLLPELGRSKVLGHTRQSAVASKDTCGRGRGSRGDTQALRHAGGALGLFGAESPRARSCCSQATPAPMLLASASRDAEPLDPLGPGLTMRSSRHVPRAVSGPGTRARTSLCPLELAVSREDDKCVPLISGPHGESSRWRQE